MCRAGSGLHEAAGSRCWCTPRRTPTSSSSRSPSGSPPARRAPETAVTVRDGASAGSPRPRSGPCLGGTPIQVPPVHPTQPAGPLIHGPGRRLPYGPRPLARRRCGPVASIAQRGLTWPPVKPGSTTSPSTSSPCSTTLSRPGTTTAKYARDADNAGQSEIAEFFRQVMSDDSERARKCHDFLAQLTHGSSPS